MLPKKNRLDLRKSEDFFENCQKIHLKEFSIYYRKNESVEDIQATVIVPKKTEKLAVHRSKIKRKYRAALQNSNTIKKTKLQMAIIVHPSGKELLVSEISEKINEHVTKIRV